jgi:phenylacetic acid degradation operon negative regulatory protein
LIVTLYGDCIAPRGSALWLGSLNTLLAPFGIEPGLVRTALSRLVAEGWFERNRVGRNSFYRLSAHGAGEFARAAGRIYAAVDPPWRGELEIAVLATAEPDRRQAEREVLVAQGFGQLAPNVMVRPRPTGAAADTAASSASDCFRLTATAADPRSARGLAAACWNLDALGEAYRSLMEDIAPLARAPDRLVHLPDAKAFATRLLLVHEWRRIVLRDPHLPAGLLPEGWPGAAARAAVGRIYAAVTPGCERWLDTNAVAEGGQLSPRSRDAARRFAIC